jgi:transposase InsO family protein
MIDRHDQHQEPLGDAQNARRSAEQATRCAAVELVDTGHTQAAVAQTLQLAPQTLSAWMDRPAEPLPRGRPPAPVDPVMKMTVTELLDSHGRSIGLPALKRLFPQVPRSALHRLRDQWADEQHIEPCRLKWTTPGSVWSADFTRVPSPIDGLFDHVLVVRDLASQSILLAAPCMAQAADAVVFHCRQLFQQYAAPLVLKTDNGSPFIADQTRELFRRNAVVNLLSPPLTPQYNGSIEATGGQLKTRAALLAQLGTCDTWTSDILEAARLHANALNKPWGPAAPTPDQRWLSRGPIDKTQRASLAALIAQKTIDITQSIQRERLLKGFAIELSAACAATVARTAIRQALVELGYLQIRRPPITSTKNIVDLSRN